MIYTLEQIKEFVEPIAQKYKLKALWVFGSYARGEATEESDVDFLMDYTDSIATGFFGFMGLLGEFKQILNKNIDLISTRSLFTSRTENYYLKFMNIVSNERVLIYDIERKRNF
ncbi:MAG: nucleotidyltransferase domain-containing protein [Deltaproteobacteria bacterium]|jgi:predicted nucleotidyltransferase|nr:nucleotidyltransferase domain-containing protein [Deltaproteobacteria bacterium]